VHIIGPKAGTGDAKKTMERKLVMKLGMYISLVALAGLY